jgi:hypothetical protein
VLLAAAQKLYEAGGQSDHPPHGLARSVAPFGRSPAPSRPGHRHRHRHERGCALAPSSPRLTPFTEYGSRARPDRWS